MILANLWRAILSILSIIAGIFIVPGLLMETPVGYFCLRNGNSIWGNAMDGISGPSWYPAWVAKQGWFVRTFPRYWWIAVRNPAQNLRSLLGAHGILQAIDRSKPNPHVLGAPYIVHATISGRQVVFYYDVVKWPGIDRYCRIAIGPKIWETAKIGDRIDCIFAISLLPFVTKATASID